MNALSIALALLMTTMGQPAQAQPQPKGYIQNHTGAQCWYTQGISTDAQYFHKIPGVSYVLKFDKPQCMASSGLELDGNKMIIANVITRYHSHSDAKFMTRPSEIMRTSPLQVRGACIQSATYPSRGVAIEYQMAGPSIAGVRHAFTVSGCSN